MCSIANLFDTNIRKFDAKKHNFFCPECLRLCKSLGKNLFSIRTLFFSKKGEKWVQIFKGGSLIIILTNPFQCYLSLRVWCVCVLLIYTISVSIICVSQEEPSPIASDQQMYDFYKWIIFEKKRYCGK